MRWTAAQRAEAQDHIEALAARHKVEVIYGESPAESFPQYQVVHVRTPTTPSRYLEAMHELGHAIDKEALGWWRREGNEAELRMESAAWVWAALNADPALMGEASSRDWSYAASCWLSYFRCHAEDTPRG